MQAKTMLMAVAGLLLAASGPFSPRAFGVDRYWDGGGVDPNWSDKNNWTADLEPTSSGKAIIGSSTGGGETPATAVITNIGEACSNLYLSYNAGDSGTVQMASGSLSVAEKAYIGYSGPGTFTQTGGTHTVNSVLYLGYNSGSSGTYDLSGGDLLIPYSGLITEFIGYSGTGTFTQTGGTHTVSSLYLGYNTGSSGTYDLSAGDLLVDDYEYYGQSGTATFTQTGGTHTVKSRDLTLFSKATYTLSGGTLIARAVTGSGTFTQSGGTATLGRISVYGTYSLSGGTVNVTGNIDGSGTLALTGGTLNVTGNIDGSGTLALTGGTLNVTGNIDGSGTFAWDTGILNLGGVLTSSLRVGNASGSDMTVVLDGSLNLSPSAMYVGYSGRGAVTQGGGANTVNSSLYLGQLSGSEGTYTLSEGSLSVGSAYVGCYGTGHFNQTGGVHKANSLLISASCGSGAGIEDLRFWSEAGFFVPFAPGTNCYVLPGDGWTDYSFEDLPGGGSGGDAIIRVYDTTPVTIEGRGGSGSYANKLYLFDEVICENTHSTGWTWVLGDVPNLGSGTYSLENGELDVAKDEHIGKSGSGTFVQTGGKHVVIGLLSIGSAISGSGQYTLSDGELTIGQGQVGNAGIGTFTQTGGTQTISGSLSLGSHGTFALAGGVLSTGLVSIAAGGRFTVTGGTFRPSSVSVSGELIHTGPGDTYTPSLTVENGGTCRVRPGDLSAGITAVFGGVVMEGGRLLCPSISLSGIAGGRIEGFGTVQGTIHGDAFSTIQASGGELVLGDAGVWNGFSTTGAIHAGQWTLTLKSRGFVTLGSLTTLDGGIINAANGLTLGMGANLVGAGHVNGKIAAGLGSTISASGNLAIGDGTSYAGFISDGELYTDNHTVTINDRNAAVLGSLTQIGNASGPGSLAAPNGLVLNQGKNLVGYGTIVGTGNFIVDGDVMGEGPHPSDGITFNIPVVGGFGGFEGNVTFNSGFSPGHSPGQAVLHNVTFGSSNTLNIELGGQAAGSQYDQLIVSGTSVLGGSLDVTLLYGFTPKLGDAFMLIDGSALSGEFSSTGFPSLGGGLDWAIIQTGSNFILRVALLGDADLSGVVDAADYIALKTHFGLGSAAARADGDLDRDGDVDWNDLQTLMSNFGRRSADTPVSTPEPATLSLLALLALSLPKRGGMALLRSPRRPTAGKL